MHKNKAHGKCILKPVSTVLKIHSFGICINMGKKHLEAAGQRQNWGSSSLENKCVIISMRIRKKVSLLIWSMQLCVNTMPKSLVHANKFSPKVKPWNAKRNYKKPKSCISDSTGLAWHVKSTIRKSCIWTNAQMRPMLSCLPIHICKNQKSQMWGHPSHI